MTSFAPEYQSYFASFAATGDVNKLKDGSLPTWVPATNDSNNVDNVLFTRNGLFQEWQLGSDSINTWDACGFWYNAAVFVESQSNLPKWQKNNMEL